MRGKVRTIPMTHTAKQSKRASFRIIPDLWLLHVSDSDTTSLYIIRARTEHAALRKGLTQLAHVHGNRPRPHREGTYTVTGSNEEIEELYISLQQYTFRNEVTLIYGA